ncbi:ribonuclease HII [Pseudodesulfovibrio sp. F-1]|uniref:Ribonuclease HII n=1 Tax=Pseudodesulfovibrio alkaliphilus TaxID=2661613 RepID=A0A7K1KNS6_9BACT|nr:ribonuclease HII [Pseudodesulfovibrio alkaliphilus]MUM77733.1 ribonuclease HII [Pseudodesulfovibrio alkaliphilus]
MSLVPATQYPPHAVAGVDEAGRGCLAGPVVAGVCILPETYDLPGLTDSKKLAAVKREALYPRIREQAVAWAVGLSWPGEIDRVNILQATFLAMGRAVRAMKASAALLRIDGNKTIPGHALGLRVAQEWVVGGDGSVPAISAASVLAKTFRDRLMVRLATRYPGYGLERHMGYGTREHLEAIVRLGPCRIHRLTFRGVRSEPEPQRQGSLF